LVDTVDQYHNPTTRRCVGEQPGKGRDERREVVRERDGIPRKLSQFGTDTPNGIAEARRARRRVGEMRHDRRRCRGESPGERRHQRRLPGASGPLEQAGARPVG
jgi:hypothetical protein